jgi:hypothetical protein
VGEVFELVGGLAPTEVLEVRQFLLVELPVEPSIERADLLDEDEREGAGEPASDGCRPLEGFRALGGPGRRW